MPDLWLSDHDGIIYELDEFLVKNEILASRTVFRETH
jgi:hypothetical protein